MPFAESAPPGRDPHRRPELALQMAVLIVSLFHCSAAMAELTLFVDGRPLTGVSADVQSYSAVFSRHTALLTVDSGHGATRIIVDFQVGRTISVPLVVFATQDCTGAAYAGGRQLDKGWGALGPDNTVYSGSDTTAEIVVGSRWTETGCRAVKDRKTPEQLPLVTPGRRLGAGYLQLGVGAVDPQTAALSVDGTPLLGTAVDLVDTAIAADASAGAPLVGSNTVQDNGVWGLAWFLTGQHRAAYLYLRFNEDSYPEGGNNRFFARQVGLLFPTNDCSGDTAFFLEEREVTKGTMYNLDYALLGPGNRVFVQSGNLVQTTYRSKFQKTADGARCTKLWLPRSGTFERFNFAIDLPDGAIELVAPVHTN